jgi:hypothetical protein
MTRSLIAQWIPFNERWGQHRTMKVGEWITDNDTTRQISISSGGNFYPVRPDDSREVIGAGLKSRDRAIVHQKRLDSRSLQHTGNSCLPLSPPRSLSERISSTRSQPMQAENSLLAWNVATPSKEGKGSFPSAKPTATPTQEITSHHHAQFQFKNGVRDNFSYIQ